MHEDDSVEVPVRVGHTTGNLHRPIKLEGNKIYFQFKQIPNWRCSRSSSNQLMNIWISKRQRWCSNRKLEQKYMSIHKASIEEISMLQLSVTWFNMRKFSQIFRRGNKN
ncbi:MAG: hypothetical protein DLM72_10470 [Candidatus Nitrosopolaris wilkensis]|nr:MAG: hypothetical protein DLM72_10470 [Candidatus Nitrosopolaris wilkensis]